MGQTPYKSFLRNYYLAGSLYDCIFAYAMYTVLFQIRGLSVLQISMLLAIWSLFAIAFEIPTGGLADSWSRRRMLIIAPLVKALCFLVWTIADGHFWMYVLGFGFWSLGSSFVSGTSEALLYDTLVHFGKSEEYERVLGRKHFFFNISLGVACITGGFMAALNLNLPLIASIIPLILSSIFFSRIRQVSKVKSTEETHYLQHIRAAMGEMRTNRTLLYLGIYLWGIFTIFGYLEEYDQLYYKLVGLPIAAFGVVGFIVSMLVAWSSSHAYRFSGRRSVFFAFPAAGGCILLLVGRFPSMPMVALLCLSYALIAPVRVLTESRIQRSIQSLSRATVTSVISFMMDLFGFGFPMVLGVISRIWNLQAIYLSSGLFLFVFAFWAFLVRQRVNGETVSKERGS